MKPLTNHLAPMDRSEKRRKGEAVKRMVESEGWAVLLELIEQRQRHEQKVLMQSPVREGDQSYERIIGQWGGMERVPALAAGMIDVGEQASREMESGQAAEAAN